MNARTETCFVFLPKNEEKHILICTVEWGNLELWDNLECSRGAQTVHQIHAVQ